MGKNEDEIRRLQRLRDEQLQARDPQAKARTRNQRLATKHRWVKKKTSVWEIIRDFPAKWYYMLIGLLITFPAAVLLNVLVNAPWTLTVGGVIVLFGVVAGRVIGAVFDWRDEGWNR